MNTKDTNELEGDPSTFTVSAFGQKITQDDAINFFKDKGVNLSCPACGNKHRTLMLTGASDETSMVIPTKDVIPGDGTENIFSTNENRPLPVFGLWCPNCGNVQLHTLGSISSWMSESAAKAGKNAKDGDSGDPE